MVMEAVGTLTARVASSEYFANTTKRLALDVDDQTGLLRHLDCALVNTVGAKWHGGPTLLDESFACVHCVLLSTRGDKTNLVEVAIIAVHGDLVKTTLILVSEKIAAGSPNARSLYY